MISLGEVLSPYALAETRADDGSVSTGSVVGLDGNGAMTPASDTVDLAGVLTESSGMCLSGLVVASVDTGDPDGAVLDGTQLEPSPSGGVFRRAYTTDVDDNFDSYVDGPAFALSDEGGTWQGHDVPDGAAVVLL